MKRALTGFGIGAVLGAATVYLVLRDATDRFETRALQAEAVAAVHQAAADSALAVADSIREARVELALAPRPVTRDRLVRILETVPDSAAVDSLLTIVAERDTAVAARDSAIGSLEGEIGALRMALAHQTVRGDTLAAALASRPSAVVTWDWRPKLNGQVFADVQLSGDWCAGAGPSLSLWRAQVTAYVAACQAIPRIEPRLGTRVTLTF